MTGGEVMMIVSEKDEDGEDNGDDGNGCWGLNMTVGEKTGEGDSG